jgi:outer membrane receptor protein involved in Fe transport
MLAIICTSALVPYQSATGAELEEIIVTARKQEESLQDVPISIQAISGDQIAEQGIFDIQQLAPYTPNFSYITAAGASDMYFMRGLGTYGSGIHFEPSVGQVFNGFFSTRSRLGRSALIDLAQVEVLKGPQGAIIGKNTSLGAINIRSNKPTEEFEALVSTQYNFKASEGYEVEGMVSGPLSDRVRGRAVVNYRDTDGWVDNNTTGDTNQQSQDLTARVLLDFDLSDAVTAELLYQRTDFDRKGKARVVAGCLEYQPPAGPPQSIPRAESLGFICSGVTDVDSTTDLRRDAPGGPVFNSEEPFSIKSNMYGLTLTADLEKFTLTSLTGYLDYGINDMFSGDQIDAERVTIQNTEDYDQFYQEIRINGANRAGTLDYIAGAMYFTGDLDATQSFHAIAAVIGPPVPAINPAVSRNEFQHSKTDSLAGFGQVNYHFNDQFTLSLGVRVTDEDRNGSKAQVVGEVYTSDLNNAPVACNTPTVPLSACTMGDDGLTPGAPITGKISDTKASYNVALQYAVNDNNNYYVSAATGFKSGGFDLRGGGGSSSFVFGDEESTNFELGGRHTLADGSLRFNWTIYHTEVDGLQSSANDPVLIQQTVQPADATSDGVEVDLSWATPMEGLVLSVVGAYTDATYDNFVGSCYLSQPENGTGCTNVAVAAGQRAGVQDLKGKTLPLAPDYSMVIGADYRVPVGSNMDLQISAKYLYTDDQVMSIERDPAGFLSSTSRFDASVMLSSNAGNHPWSVAVIGRNLGDEIIHTFVNSSTLSGSALVVTNIEETRSVALRATIGF